MYPEVLILSSIYDFSADLVSRLLFQRGIPYLRVNREQLADYRFTLDPIEPWLLISNKGVNYKIDSNHLNSIWYRQPVFLRNTPSKGLSPREQLIRSQWIAFLRGLSLFDKAKWMNWPQATYLAESKPYQLYIANLEGFNIPTTRMGNDITGIKESNLGSQIILKSIDTALLLDGNDCLFTYSTISNHEDWQDEEVYEVPLLAQELIESKSDIRVTVIGDETVSVRILENGCGVDGDWRVKPKDTLEFETYELNAEIKMKCINLTKRLGLSFSAIDLLEAEGDTFFLEVNPTGEWGWLTNDNRPIDRIISNWLINRELQRV